MSGFAGLVRLEATAATDGVDRAAIARMAQAIAFRGPDGVKQEQRSGASFAFALLKRGPAPQDAEQPSSLDGQTWLIGDVRCDGRAQLLSKLEQHGGHVPSGATGNVTGERLLLQYFAAFGESGLPEILGDLSFAFWQEPERRLTAFRDLTGARPFFYASNGTMLAFSNTLQALLTLPWLSREFDEQFLGDFLLESPCFDQARTVYKQIRRLPAGHLLEYSRQGLTTRRIANMPVEEPLVLSPQQYVEEFRSLFTQAMRDQLPEIDATILLSGGLDSTTLTACAVSLRKSTPESPGLGLRAYTVDSRPLYSDEETGLASRLAAKFGIPCEVEHSGKVLPFTSGADLDEPLPEPALDPYALLYRFYFMQIAKSSRVVFSGTGGDELLRLQALPYLRYLRGKRGLLAPASALAKFVISQRKLPSIGAGIRTRFRSFFGRKPTPAAFPPWLNEAFSRRLDLPARWETLQSPLAAEHPSNPVAYAAVNDGSVSSILETYDAFWTGCPLEMRLPFIDRRLTRFLLRVPTIPWAMEKHLLRESQRGILPDEIRLRKKVPLPGDDMLLHREAGDWDPVPRGVPTDLVSSLVNWEQVISLIRQSTDETLHLHLRPVALDLWLKAVENNGRIQ